MKPDDVANAEKNHFISDEIIPSSDFSERAMRLQGGCGMGTRHCLEEKSPNTEGMNLFIHPDWL